MIFRNIVNFLKNTLFLYPEHKIYFFLCLLSYLFGLLEKVGTYISLSQIIILFIGSRSIKCMIEGKCYKDIYFFLIVFTFTNILIVIIYKHLSYLFPKTINKIINNKNSESSYAIFTSEVIQNLPKKKVI